MTADENLLAEIKSQRWFYEFDLPDGSVTECYLPENVRLIHKTRTRALTRFLDSAKEKIESAVDVACHEGYFTQVLRNRVARVDAFDRNNETLQKAQKIDQLLGKGDVRFHLATLAEWQPQETFDLVLSYGLLYHVEDPVGSLRRLAALSKNYLCLETQVLPVDVEGQFENGSFEWMRDSRGTFGLFMDDPDNPEGGNTQFAVVPNRKAFEFILKSLGFQSIIYYQPGEFDYEQFIRRQRIILFASKN